MDDMEDPWQGIILSTMCPVYFCKRPIACHSLWVINGHQRGSPIQHAAKRLGQILRIERGETLIEDQ